MSIKFDKCMLLILAVFLMLVIIPTSFAEDINGADVVGVNDDSTVDEITLSAADVKQYSSDNSSNFVSTSEVEKTEINDRESDLLGYGENIIISPSPNTVFGYTLGESKNIVVSISFDSEYTKQDVSGYVNSVYVFVNGDKNGDEIFGVNPIQSAFNFNLNSVANDKWQSGTNTLKFGYAPSDVSYLEDYCELTLDFKTLTVNLADTGSGSGDEGDSIWVNGSYTGNVSDGKKKTPYKTIAAGVSAASAGQTVKIAEGNYILTSQITISKNIALVGVGKVNITRNGGQIFSKSTAIGSISFTGLNFINGYSSTNSGIYYDFVISGSLGTLKFINCSFIGNTAPNLIRSYDNVVFDGCSFINNTATGTDGTNRAAILFKLHGNSALITVTNSIFINNKMTTSYRYLFNDFSNGAKLVTTNSFWGSNEKPNFANLFNHGISSTTLNSWAVIDTEISDDVSVGDEPQLTLKFKSNSTDAGLSDIEGTMPNLTVTLTPTIGNINSPTVIMSNNEGVVTYAATTEGDESITIKEGNQKLATSTFHVDESPINKLFVDGSYAGGDSDGSKAKPYTTIKDALDNLADNSQIVVKKGTYILDNYAINSDVIIGGKEDNVIITTAVASHMTITIGKTVNLTNLIFKGATATSIVSNGILNITNSVFEDNSGTNVISSTEGSVNIAYTVFKNNEVTGKIVDVIAGNVDNNFWGSNDEPNVSNALTLNNYVIANVTIPSMREDNELESEVTHDIKIKFTLNDGSELDKSLHNVTVTLTSTIGEVTDSVVISDNEAIAQFISNNEGEGQIDVKLNDITLKTLQFTVIERETGRIFVNASYEDNDSDGSKSKPFKTLTEAITKNNNDGGNQEIIIYEGDYVLEKESYGFLISKNVNITARGNVIIDLNGYAFNRYVNIPYGQSYPNVVLNNLVIKNCSRQSIFQYTNDLTMNNCIVTNSTGGNNIIGDARGNVVISNSSFTNIKFDANYNLITLYSGSSKSINISNSVFNNIIFRNGKYVLSGSNVNIDGNFWGTNNPSSLFPSSVKLNNWVVATLTIAETIVQGQNPTLTAEFKLNNGDALTENLPTTVFGLTSLLENTFAPETITIANNIGAATYITTNNGNEVINLTSNDKTITSIERSIEEGDDPSKIFVDEKSNVSDADGSKDKPFNNLKDAFDAITTSRNTVVLLEGSYAISNYTLNNNVTIRWSKKQVNVTAKNLVIASDVTISDLIFRDGNTITVNNGAELTIENSQFINNTGGITSAGDLSISETQFINTTNAITATAGIINVEFSAFIVSDNISIASGVTGKINNNYWDKNVPTDIGGVELTNWIVLQTTLEDTSINASEVQTLTITFKNTTDGTTFSDLVKTIPILNIIIKPTIGSVDNTSINLDNVTTVQYNATSEGDETINFTANGIAFKTLEFNVGTSVAGKIFVNTSYTGGSNDGSRLKPFTKLNDAISKAQSGNKIIIYEGTYIGDSYYSLYYKDLEFIGVGEVILTRTKPSSSYSGHHLFDLNGRGTYTFNNIIFANVDASGSNNDYGSVFYISSSDSNTLNIINCTFVNNTAASGVIYMSNRYGYGNVNVQGTKFVNNTASNGYLIRYFGGIPYKLTINNSIFINNTYKNYVIYNRGSGYSPIDLNNNFWGSNILPSDVTVPSTMPTTWIVVNATIDADKITAGDKPTLKLKFLSSDGENLTELSDVIPNVTVSLASILNTIDGNIIISNNFAKFTYDAINDGDEVITISLGDNQLISLPFVVEEKDDGTKVFVDATYVGESDGSKDKPYNNLKDAFDSAKLTGKKYISIAEGTYEIANYEIESDIEITGKKIVTIKATDLVINANTIFNNLIFDNGNAITLNANKNLSIYESVFSNNDGVIISNGNLLINTTKFINNAAIDVKGIINALAGTINISYSEFIKCDGGSVIVYSDVAGDLNNNYWSNNDEVKVSDIIKPTSWIKINVTLNGYVYMDKEIPIMLQFVLNDGSALDVNMPKLDITLTPIIGSITPVVTMIDNKASATYLSNVEGEEVIDYIAGNITFEVVEDETGKLFVAPSDYERDTTKVLGSKANPYVSLTQALSAASAENEIVMFKGTYTTSSYYTVNKNNLKITGRGKVILTSSSTSNYYFINAAGKNSYSAGYSLKLTNLIFENITLASGYNNQYGLIYYKGYRSYYGTPTYRDLTVINCTFNNNKAYYGAIYSSGYASLNVTGSTFYNNTGTGGAFIYLYSNVQSFNVNYNIFIDNKYSGYYGSINGPASGNVDYNFWGSNNKPVKNKDYGTIDTLNNWIVANIDIDNNNLLVGNSATVTFKFKYTTDGETFIDLSKSMPKVTFDLTKQIGTVPENITIENNIGEVTYIASSFGDEVITVKYVGNLEFYVNKSASSIEIIIGSSYFVGDNFTIIINNNTVARVTINNVSYEIVDGKVKIDTTMLPPGKYDINATIDENEYYFANSTNASFTLTNSLSVVIEKINEGEKLNITINDEAKSTGIATVTIDDTPYNINVVDGYGSEIKQINLKAGTYEINTVLGNYKNTTSLVINLREIDLRFDISETTVGQKTTIKIIAPYELIGDEITVFVDSTKFTATRDNNFSLKTDVLPAGMHTLTAIYLGDNIYLGVNSTTFTVNKISTTINVTSANINAGEVAKINIKLSENISANVHVDINSNKQVISLVNGIYELNITNLKVGTYNIRVSYKGDDVYSACENTTATIVVNSNNAGLKANSSDVKIGEDVIINVKINSTVTGKIIVKLDDNEYIVKLTNDKGIVTISNLGIGTYTADVIFDGDDIFHASKINVTFTVSKKELSENINISMDIPEGTTAPEFSINLPSDVTGNFTVTVDGTPYTQELVNGSATVKIPELSVGNHTISSSYSGDSNYNGFTPANQTVNISKASIPGGENALNIITPNGTESPTFSIKLPSDAKGNLTVTVDGNTTYTQELVNGSANITVSGLSKGNHNITITYTGDNKYSPVLKTTTLNVHIPVYAISNNKDIHPYYSAKTYYKVLITKDGKAVGIGENVTIKYNGRTYTVKTDSKGYATFKINTELKVKKYTITASYKGNTVKNTISIKNIIKAENKNVKKSNKLTKIKVSLKKVNSKYLKDKQIKIKFKGKIYKVKTNKKGVATWKIKKSMVKKLKVGKKYKYKVTYGKNTITKKIKIKR